MLLLRSQHTGVVVRIPSDDIVAFRIAVVVFFIGTARPHGGLLTVALCRGPFVTIRLLPRVFQILFGDVGFRDVNALNLLLLRLLDAVRSRHIRSHSIRACHVRHTARHALHIVHTSHIVRAKTARHALHVVHTGHIVRARHALHVVHAGHIVRARHALHIVHARHIVRAKTARHALHVVHARHIARARHALHIVHARRAVHALHVVHTRRAVHALHAVVGVRIHKNIRAWLGIRIRKIRQNIQAFFLSRISSKIHEEHFESVVKLTLDLDGSRSNQRFTVVAPHSRPQQTDDDDQNRHNDEEFEECKTCSF